MFQFGKLSEKDEKAMLPLEEGIYEFVIETVMQKSSTKGYPQIELELKIYDIYSNPHTVKDWLTASDANLNKKKIKEFCHAVGMADKYESGQFDEYDIVGKRGQCRIIITNHEKYGEQNRVDCYVIGDKPVNEMPASTSKVGVRDGFEDDIPF